MKRSFTLKQFKNAHTSSPHWQETLKKKLKLSLAFFLTLLFSSTLSAQITIDGNPIDWTNFTSLYPTNSFVIDANNTNDDQFTQGSKDGNAISSWAWSNGQTNNKGDITNAASLLTVVNGDNILYFCGDRAVNNGDAAIGFWFFKTAVAKVGTTSGTFSGSHANGDLLVVSHFTGGGGTAKIYIYEWLNGQLTGPDSSNNGAVNSVSYPVPSPFKSSQYSNGKYPIGDFFEGKVDLTTLKVPACFSNFMLETRNSQSITASLQDLAFGSFTQTIAPPITTGAQRCGPGSVTLKASSTSTGDTLKWYSDSTLLTKVFTGSNYTVSITAATTFYVTVTTADGCVSRSTPVTGIVNPIPTAGANSPVICIGNSATLTATTNAVSPTYSWSPGGATTASITVSPTTTTTYTVTITDGKGCSNSGSGTVTVNSLPTVNVNSPSTCAGGSATLTATTNASNPTYLWSTGATTASISVSPTTQTTYSCTVTDGTTKCSKTASGTVTINANPSPPSVLLDPISCTDATFSVTITNPTVGSYYTLTQMAGGVAQRFPATGTYSSGPAQFTGLTLGKGYSVVETTILGCHSDPSQCGTFTAIPLAVSTINTQPIESGVIKAYPNPFTNSVKFAIKSPSTGKGTLELYNMVGQKIKVIYEGLFEKGVMQTFDYASPGAQRAANLIYLFRIDNMRFSGKLINLK